jgi:hypothetical protein
LKLSDNFMHLPHFRRIVVGVAGLWTVLSAPVAAIGLPSGVEADVHEVLIEEIGTESWLRFRMIAPQIGRQRDDAPDFALLEQDFPHICETLVLPYLVEYELNPDRVVISVSDRAVRFGTSNPAATQYFEMFRIENGLCIWEAY